MPTGVVLHDARQRLFDAAERVLVRDGPAALTSRVVTAEAGVAKGVMHRHFADFDAFLTELALDRIARIDAQAAVLRAAAGTGSVAGNLADALSELFGPVTLGIVGLVLSRDHLRGRLRDAGSSGVPLLAEATAMIASYLDAERNLGRIAPGADVKALAPALVGTGHLLFADRKSAAPTTRALRRAVTAVLTGVDGPTQ